MLQVGGNRVAGQLEVVVETGCFAWVGAEVRKGEPARFAIFFLVKVECQHQPGAFAEGLHQLEEAPVEAVAAVGFPEEVGLAVVEVSVVARGTGGSRKAGVVGIKVVRPKDILGADGEGAVGDRHVGHVVEGAGGLRAKHQRGAAADEFEAIHHVEGRHVIGLGITKRIAVDGDAILEDLEKLGTLRGADTAVAEADHGGGFLRVEQAGGHGKGLTVVVGLHLGEGVQIDDSGPLSGEDAVVLHAFGEGVLDDAVVFGFAVDGEGVEDARGGLGEDEGGEESGAEEEAGVRGDAEGELHGGAVLLRLILNLKRELAQAVFRAQAFVATESQEARRRPGLLSLTPRRRGPCRAPA